MSKPEITCGTICSGIGGPDIPAAMFGMKTLWMSDIEAGPNAVLDHRFPGVDNLGDMTTIADRIRSREVPAVMNIFGGTPCQDFSTAGNRQSLAGERGNLTLEYYRIVEANDDIRESDGLARPVAYWENVPGVLNTKDNAFGNLIGALAGHGGPLRPPESQDNRWGYSGVVIGPRRTVVWRTFDSQFFGLAQHRSRCFLVAGPSSTDPRDVAEILFEWEGLRRDSGPSRQERQIHPVVHADKPDTGGVGGEASRQSDPDRQAGVSAGHGEHLEGAAADGQAEGTGGGGPAELDGWKFAIPDISQTVRTLGFSRPGSSEDRLNMIPEVSYQPVTYSWAKGKGSGTSTEWQASIPEISPTVTAGPPFSRTGNERVEVEAMVADVSATISTARGPSSDMAWATSIPEVSATLLDQHNIAVETEPNQLKGKIIPETAATIVGGCAPGAEAEPQTLRGKLIPETAATLLTEQRPGNDFNPDSMRGKLIPDVVSQALNAKWSKESSGPAGDEVHNMVPEHSQAVTAFWQGQRGGGDVWSETNNMIPEATDPAVIQAMSDGVDQNDRDAVAKLALDLMMAGQRLRTRRLTPVECEVLQGFPPGWTAVPKKPKKGVTARWLEQCRRKFIARVMRMAPWMDWRLLDLDAAFKQGIADGPRYKMVGNAISVPVAAWILERGIRYWHKQMEANNG